MFCPNCGKDCKDFKFCPDCGYDLQKIAVDSQQEAIDALIFEERRKALENAGKLHCPECLSTNFSLEESETPSKDYLFYRNAYVHLVGYFVYLFTKKIYRDEQKKGPLYRCMNCNCIWYPKLIGMRKLYRPYLAELLGENDSVVYPGENGSKLTLEWARLIMEHPGMNPVVIWYCNLYAAEQRLAVGPECRWITLLDKKYKRMGYAQTLKGAQIDKYHTIVFDIEWAESFRKVKDVLNAIIEENKKAGIL